MWGTTRRKAQDVAPMARAPYRRHMDLESSDPRPLLRRGCPVCGGQLLRASEIAPAAWVVFLVLVALGLLAWWVLLPVAIIVPLASQTKVLKCKCGFKQRYG